MLTIVSTQHCLPTAVATTSGGGRHLFEGEEKAVFKKVLI